MYCDNYLHYYTLGEKKITECIPCSDFGNCKNGKLVINSLEL